MSRPLLAISRTRDSQAFRGWVPTTIGRSKVKFIVVLFMTVSYKSNHYPDVYKLVWIEEDRFRGWGCSECAWVFNPSGAPTGKSFNESVRNFELQCDMEFTSHVCAGLPKSQSTKGDVKQDWEKLYARPSSSLTGASCCSGSRTQRLRFSSDHEVYQSRQPAVGKSRKLSVGPCAF
jgi:hypothetical protein